MRERLNYGLIVLSVTMSASDLQPLLRLDREHIPFSYYREMYC